MKIILGLIIISVILNTVGQLLFKIGMNQIGVFTFSATNLVQLCLKLITNASILLGLVIYAISTGIWFLVLSRADVSFAYPLVSIGYIFNAVAAYYLLHEHAFSPMRFIGTVTIMIGVVLICQS